MAEIDLDDLLNTGLEDVDKIEVEPELAVMTESVGSTKKVNYNIVERAQPTSRLSLPPKGVVVRPSYNANFKVHSLGSSVSPGTPSSEISNPIDFYDNCSAKEQFKQPSSEMKLSRNNCFVSKQCRSPSEFGVSINDKRLKRNSAGNIGSISDIFGPTVAQIPGLPKTRYIAKEKVYSQDQLFGIIDRTNFDIPLSDDPWSSVSLPMEAWNNEPIEQSDNIVDVNCAQSGYQLEVSSQSIKKLTDLMKYSIIDIDLDFPYYSHYFKGKKSTKYYMDPISLNLLIVDTSTKYKRAILKTPKENYRCVIPLGVDPAKYDKAFPLQEKKKRSKPKTFDKKNIPKLELELERIENMSIIKKYKFGVIYVKDGQKEENEFFSNDECCDEFWDFMNSLGKKVELKGFNDYAAGLDTKAGCTGTYSYFRKYTNTYSIMFHVAPLLPNQEGDAQKLERKRHVGNDVVVIVFLDPKRKEPFDPRILTSHFNNVFFIIQPKIKNEGLVVQEGYTINVVTKPNNMPFPPFLTSSWMKKGFGFEDFMLKKLINAERMTMYNTTFLSNARNTRKQQLVQLAELL
ncbi:Rap/Ran GTPase-activating protein, putative [Entamoeba histolytica HM-3:IMSS]|uniref:Rap/Ran GTPase-activating protein, putative n=2 Tax=Entamoeba histolytica TaxID=5759 RepID=M2S3V8_ENTHI|nr:Rap/Ran GTPase-activating protein, putative [Entamoeba histolytica KU27]EMS17708.1 Rap/Ran GTPase-activating protein, putative [Entamoeba histolytica HM-3:IMSS]